MNRAVWMLVAGLACLAGCERPLTESASYSPSNVTVLRTALEGDKTAGGAAAAAPEPTGWATLRGTFQLNGAPPPPKQLNVTSDHAVCQPGGKPVFLNELVVGPAGGIQNVVVFLSTKYPDGDAKWEHPEAVAAKANPPPFDQKQCVFLTHVFTMRASATLKVLNSDPVGHNTNISGGGNSLGKNFNVPAGSSENYAPGGESAEPFAVACNIHPWMAAYGLVRKSPYFEVTNEQGEFVIKNLPAGVPIELRVWQEKLKFIQNVKLDGLQPAEKYNKGRLSLKLANDEERQLSFAIEAAEFAGK